MTPFTPIGSFLGGLLIGIATVGLLLISGRIAGIAGILRRVLMPDPQSRPFEALAFVVGLFLSPGIWMSFTDLHISQTVSNNIPVVILAGLLVGFGSILGSGCTSGHGVCGLSRLSPRSFVATGIFMSTGAVTVFFLRHIIGG